MYDIQFTDETYGSIACASGYLLRTNDGGASWSEQRPCTGSLRAVHFNDWLNGWVAGAGGIYFTDCAGAFWENQTSGDFRGMDFLNDSTAWAVGDNGLVMYTSDGGQTWVSAGPPGGFPLSDVDFLDSQEGWISGVEASTSSDVPIAYHTDDGGLTWSLDTLASPFPDRYDYNNGYCIRALSPGKAFWGGESGMLFSTDDGGASWISHLSVCSPEDIYGVHFISEQEGWAFSYGDYLIHTDDGGETWQNRSPSDPTSQLFSVFFLDDGLHGWLGRADGHVLRTTDGGLTWTDSYCGVSNTITDLEFNDSGFGVAAGGLGLIRQSHDWGETWESVPVSTSSTLQDVEFADESSGFVGGWDGTILRFDMGGDSWCDLQNPHDYPVHMISALDPDHVWAAIVDGWSPYPTYLESTNGGSSWTRKTVYSFEGYFPGIRFFNEAEGLASVEGRGIAWTSDGGESWEHQILPTPEVYEYSPVCLLNMGKAIIPAVESSGVLQAEREYQSAEESAEAGVFTGARQGPSVSPNPGNWASQTLRFETAAECRCRISVYDVAGRLVRRRDLGRLGPGEHSVSLPDGAGRLSAGVYFCRVTAGRLSEATKFLIVGN